MISSSIRVTIAMLAVAIASLGWAQSRDPAPVYEALFSQVELLGLGRTYYARERERRPRLGVEAGFDFPEEIGTHMPENFGSVSVSIVDESYLDGLWDSSCREGWESFHQTFPEAQDLVEVSQIAFNGSADEAAVYILLGRGCLHAWFGTYYLKLDAGQWLVTRVMQFGEA